MRIAICEDNKSDSEALAKAIKDWADKKQTEIDIVFYNNAESFMMAWPEIYFDLVFLDIQMKNISGIELAENIRKSDKDIMLVFLSSFSQYVFKGYDVDALHFLTKPLSLEKLLPVMDRAYLIWDSKKISSIMVTTENAQYKLPFGEIFYISMFSHDAEVYTAEGKYFIRKSIKELLVLLPDEFMQCHRSCIVNLFKIRCMYKDSLVLRNGAQIPMSRNNAKQIKDAFISML